MEFVRGFSWCRPHVFAVQHCSTLSTLMVSVIARAQFAPRVQAFMGIVQRLHLSGIEAKRLSDSYTYTNSIGYNTMFLLIYLTYFGPEDGELTIGGDTLLRKELWCSGKSWYRGPATAFRSRICAWPPEKSEGEDARGGIGTSRS